MSEQGQSLFNKLAASAGAVYGLGVEIDGNRIECTVQEGTEPPNERYVVRVGDLDQDDALALLSTIGALPSDSDDGEDDEEAVEEEATEEEDTDTEPRKKRKVSKAAIGAAKSLADVIAEVVDSDPKFDDAFDGDNAESLRTDVVDFLMKIKSFDLTNLLKKKTRRATLEKAVNEYFDSSDDEDTPDESDDLALD